MRGWRHERQTRPTAQSAQASPDGNAAYRDARRAYDPPVRGLRSERRWTKSEAPSSYKAPAPPFAAKRTNWKDADIVCFRSKCEQTNPWTNSSTPRAETGHSLHSQVEIGSTLRADIQTATEAGLFGRLEMPLRTRDLVSVSLHNSRRTLNTVVHVGVTSVKEHF